MFYIYQNLFLTLEKVQVVKINPLQVPPSNKKIPTPVKFQIPFPIVGLISYPLTLTLKSTKLKYKWYRSNNYSYKWSFHWVITWNLSLSRKWAFGAGNKNLVVGKSTGQGFHLPFPSKCWLSPCEAYLEICAPFVFKVTF